MSGGYIAAATIGSAALGYLGAREQGDAIDDAAGQNYALGMEQLDFAREQFDLYETQVLPLELEAQQLGIDARQLAQQRGEAEFQMYEDFYRPMQIKMSDIAMEGTEDRTEQATRDAATSVSKEFERAKDVSKRNLERSGVRPDSGRYEATDKQAGLQEAATRSSEINKAREGEQVRQETTNFNMLASATGRAPAPVSASQGAPQPGLSPSTSAGVMSSAYNTMSNANISQANAAGLQYQAGADLLTSGVGAYSNYLSMNPSGGGGMTTAAYGSDPTANLYAPDGSFGQPIGPQFKNGGLVPKGYKDGGQVTDDPKYTQKQNELYDKVKKVPLLGYAAKWLRAQNDKKSQAMKDAGLNYEDGGVVTGPGGVDNVPALIDGRTPARLSSGEYVIPRDVKEAKGTEFFDKLIENYHDGPSPGTAGLKGAS